VSKRIWMYLFGLMILSFALPANAQTYIQSQTHALGGSGNNTATFSSAPGSGHTIVVGVVCYGPSVCQITSIADNFSNSYSQIGPTALYGGPTANGTVVALYCASGISTGSGFTITANQSNTGGGDSNIYIAEYSGVSCSVDQTASGSETDGSNTTTLQTSSATTTNANDLLVAVGGSSTGGNATAGTGYHLRQNATSGVAENGGFEDQTVTSTGSYSAKMTMASNTNYWAMVMAALKAGNFPSITSLSTSAAVAGTAITINGSNFGSTQGSNTVTFNGATATPTNWSSTSITVPVPATATNGNVVVTVGGASSNGINFTFLGNGGITYIQSKTAAVGSSGNNAATFSSAPVAGDTVVVGLACYGLNDCHVTSLTDNYSNSYTQIGPTATYGGPSQNITRVLFYCASGVATGSTFTVTSALSNSGGGDSNLYIAEYSGVTCNVDQSTTGTNGSSGTTQLQTSSATTTNGTDLILGLAGASTGGAATAGSGYNLRQNGNNGTAEYGGFEDRMVTATGSYSGNMTLTSNTSYWGMVMLALKGTSGAGSSPTITSLSPASGAVGASVTIAGANFGSTQGSSTVTFNGTAASVTSWSATSIGVTVPASASTGNVVVIAGGVNSNGVNFTVLATPAIASLNPTSGAVGAPITITGSNFGATQSSGTVKFNGTPGIVTSWGTTGIVATVPSGATSGNVVVFASGVNSNGVNFTVVPAPHITSLSPTNGSAGTSVTVTGTNFGSTQGSNGVSFNGAPASATTWSDTSVVATVPAAATTGNVVVTVSGIASNGVSFTVQSGSGGAITYIQSQTHALGSSGNNTATFSSAPGSGHTIVVGVVCYGPSVCQITSIADNFSNSYSQIGPTILYGGPTTNGTVVALYCASGISTGSGFTVTANQSNTGGGDSNLYVTEYSGVSCSVDQTANGSETDGSNTTTLQTSSATTTNANDLLATVSGSSTGGNATAGTGYTLRQTGNNGVGEYGGFEDRTVSSTGSYSGNMTLVSNTVNWGMVMAALKGNGGTGGAPSITSLSPSSGGVSTVVTISGSGFGSSQGNSTVTFNGTPGSPTSWSASSIVVPVPANATTGSVFVAVGGLSSNSITFTVSSTGTLSGAVTRASDGTGINGATVQAIQSGVVKGSATTGSNGSYSISGLQSGVFDLGASASGFLSTTQSSNLVTAGNTTTVNLVLGAPTIASLSPATGAAGQSVTINGSYFGTTQSTSTVTFNGVAASPSSWSNTKIVVVVPSSALTGPVVVTVGGIASSGIAFTIGTGSISGTVTNANGGAAISGATVTALQSNAVIASTTTAANGTYTLSSLAPGSYDVKFAASGFGTLLRAAQSVTASGTTTVNASLSSTGTISGSVTQTDGITGISGATVSAIQNGETIGSGTTTSTGSYSIPNLTAGTYAVQVTASGYSTQTQTGISVTAGVTTTTNFTMTGQSVISYSYDPLGRLTGAVDSQGYAVAYSYDVVGNLLSISRNLASQVSISGFTPASGPVNTTVTINGTAFGPTPSQNTVKFNGTTATVTSATATQLLVNVPSGATNGTISVTAPSGSATSAASFTVTASNGVPTISGFTPTIGVSSTAVTVSGTNFDVPVNDKTKFNISLARTLSATSTSISTTVPTQATSGHIAISTALGRGVSTGYFFVPPSPYAVASVGFTGTISIGGNSTAAISTAGQVGLMVFDGTAGQQVSWQTTSSTFSGCAVGITVYSPDGSRLTSNGCMGSGGFLAAQNLTQNGTYTILIVPASSGIGSLTLSLYSVTNIISTITPGGSPVNLNFTTPGQTAKLTFGGTAGQKISVQDSSSTLSGCSVALAVLNPDGTTLTSNGCMGNGGFVGEQTLASNGTYTLFLQPAGAATGGLTVTLNTVSDITGTITPGGSPVNLNFTTPGQTAKLTFNGTPGQKISVQDSSSTLSGCSVALTVLNPDGTTLTSNGCMGNSGFLAETALTQTGTHTLFFLPGASTGTLTVNLYAVSDIGGTITPSGSAVNLNFTTPGQTAKLTFSGTPGQKISVQDSSSTLSGCSVALTVLNPDGTTLTSNGCMGSSGFLAETTLTQTGTHTLFFLPGASTGTLTVNLYAVTDIGGTITPGGSAVNLNFTTPGQSASLTFSGTAGQKVSVQSTAGTLTACSTAITILNPDGSRLVANACMGNGGFIGEQTLATTGTYTLLVQPAPHTGTLTVSLDSVTDITGTITVGGSGVNLSFTVPGQTARLTFSGTAAEKVSVHSTAGTLTGCSVAISILNPDGTALVTNACMGNGGTISQQTLPSTGTYTLFAQPGAATGTLTVSMTTP
jgi:YD repeat-containing protein